ADGQTSRVVSGPVDPESTGQLLQRLRHLPVRSRKVTVRVHRGDVLVDAKTHLIFLLESGPVPPFRGRLVLTFGWWEGGLSFSRRILRELSGGRSCRSDGVRQPWSGGRVLGAPVERGLGL